MLWATAAAVLGCGERRDRSPRFFREEPGTPVPVIILKSDTPRTPRGFRTTLLHVLLPVESSEPTARATLQHLIDSVAIADTGSAAVQVLGFVMGAYDPATHSAAVEPAISATWGPLDSVGVTGQPRTARFLTNFTILRPFADSLNRQRGR